MPTNVPCFFFFDSSQYWPRTTGSVASAVDSRPPQLTSSTNGAVVATYRKLPSYLSLGIDARFRWCLDVLKQGY
jgi:hypothetical protein